ncbi:hypothetical protein Efla_005588 [Eimeria flavescens]
MQGDGGERTLGAPLPAVSPGAFADEGVGGTPPEGALPPSVSAALKAIAHAASWAETPEGWASAASAEVATYKGALSDLADACSRDVGAREAVLLWEGLPWETLQPEGGPRGAPLLLHFSRVLCSLSSSCLAEAGIDYGGPLCCSAGAVGASQEAPDGRGPSGAPAGPSSSEEWVRYGLCLLAAICAGAPSRAAAALRQLLALLYPLTSCVCTSRAAAAAAEWLNTPEGAHCFCFLAALAAAAAETEAETLPGSAAAAAATTAAAAAAAAAARDPPGEGGPAAAEASSSLTPNSLSSNGRCRSSSNSGKSGCPVLLDALGAYGGPLALPGVAAAARGGPLRGLHKAAQRGAARLLGKAASLRDSAAAVLAWLVYHRLSSSSSSSSSGSEGSFSHSNVRHLLALLIASVRGHLGRPCEQRVSALCLREALKEPRMQAAVAGPTHEAALAFVAVCLQALHALAAAAAAAANEALQDRPSSPPAGAAAAAAAAAAARMQQLRAVSPISEMLALLCASSPPVRAAVAERLASLPPPLQPCNPSSSSSSSSSSGGTPTDPQQQQQFPSQVSPGRGRSSAALSSSSLPALLFVAAWGDRLGCTYTSAFIELCVRSLGTRDLGRHLTLQQREEAVAALAANAQLPGSPGREEADARSAAGLCLLAALWEGSEAFSGVVEDLCLRPLAAAGEEALQRGDTAALLRVLHVSLDLAACSRRLLPRCQRLLQQAAAALAAGPLCRPDAAGEAEAALLLAHKCCVLSLPTPWGPLVPVEGLFAGGRDTAAAAAAAAGAAAAASAPGAEEGRCLLLRRLEGLRFLSRRPAGSGCRPLAAAMVEETRRQRAELRGLQQKAQDATKQAAQAAQRLAVTKEAHEVQCSQLREAAERQRRMHEAEEQRLQEEASKLRMLLESEQRRGRDIVAEFQRLLDAKEAAIASLQAEAAEGRSLQGADNSDVCKELQIQTAINVKQKEELSRQEARMRQLLEKQQQTGSSLAVLNAKYKQLQEEKAKLQLANEKLQEESEQQFRQLILVMKALAEQQAESEALKEERMHASSAGSQELRVQQLEQQLQQQARDHESAASAASLRLMLLEEKLRASQKEAESLRLLSKRQEGTIDELGRRLKEAAEALAGANAATTAKSELVSQMEKELKEKENRLAVISAALRGSSRQTPGEKA